jgi:5-methylcytosine-specific restriction endonuclease McrA
MSRIKSVINNYAPTCALPSCSNKSAYHNAKGMVAKWKMFCEAHRKSQKIEVDNWKLNQGCENVDGRHGFHCNYTVLCSAQLDINHIDGNRHNADPSNLEVLCRNCHAIVTVEHEHHKNRYINEVSLNEALWEIE